MNEQQKRQGTYLFDPESTAEMERLIGQGRMMTNAMGGPLTGLPDLSPGARIVDLACGAGGWVLDAASTSPESEIVGVDISRIMLDYADALARSRGLTNISFTPMDITQPLGFSDHSFDLVNARSLFGVLRRDAWRPFIAECSRILRPGGTLRLTEAVDIGVTNSVATERLLAAFPQTLWKLGYCFSVDGRSYAMHPVLPAFLREAGYQNIYTLDYAVDFSAGTPVWLECYQNYKVALLQSKPIFLKAGVMTEEEFEQSYQEMLIDMKQPGFCAIFTFVSVIGSRATKSMCTPRHASLD